uniref:Nuclear distribution protein nudE-like 1-B n=1 Tax=Heterorhabditis bacteriophora TaxID=37862 RepID=A0A1I7XU49_HETBA
MDDNPFSNPQKGYSLSGNHDTPQFLRITVYQWKSIDWAKEYFKKEEELRKTREELKAANEELRVVNEELRAVNKELREFHGKQHAVYEEVKEALRLNTDLAVANKELEKDLISSNMVLLQEKKSLSASGVVELFESKNFVCAPSNCKGRQFKYEWLYNKCEIFKNNVQKYVGSNISDRDVGLLGKDWYASASHDIHGSLNNGNEVIIRRKGSVDASGSHMSNLVCKVYNDLIVSALSTSLYHGFVCHFNAFYIQV